MTTVDVSPQASYAGAMHRPAAQDMMTAGGILPPGRSSADLLDAVAALVYRYERPWSTPGTAQALGEAFAEAIHSGQATLGSPALSNLWSARRPLASCAAVPGPANPATAEAYYLDNMGSGYNLDHHPDPIAALAELNDHAAAIEQSGRCERYVGNMAHLSVGHPALAQLIQLKVHRDLPHFNLSVNWTESDLTRLFAGDRHAAQLLDEIATAAWACGDPGIICLERFNRTNPLRDTSPYITTAPCAEVGLAAGDTCVFAYLNLAAFLRTPRIDDYDLDALRATVALTVQVLDDVLDADQQHLANPLSRHLASHKRRIGISVCGYADLLVWLGLDYGSPPAVALLEDLLSVIAYQALSSSLQLATRRGVFAAFGLSDWANGTHRSPPPTRQVSDQDWASLHDQIRRLGLRHSSMTALPPSGRASILLGVNPSIEPLFDDPGSNAATGTLGQHARRQDPSVRRLGHQIAWSAHLAVVQAAARQIDESVSKTVNLAASSTIADVRDIYFGFMHAGLKAISVYRPPA